MDIHRATEEVEIAAKEARKATHALVCAERACAKEKARVSRRFEAWNETHGERLEMEDGLGLRGEVEAVIWGLKRVMDKTHVREPLTIDRILAPIDSFIDSDPQLGGALHRATREHEEAKEKLRRAEKEKEAMEKKLKTSSEGWDAARKAIKLAKSRHDALEKRVETVEEARKAAESAQAKVLDQKQALERRLEAAHTQLDDLQRLDVQLRAYQSQLSAKLKEARMHLRGNHRQ